MTPDIVARLRDLRARAGLTQKEAAIRSGVHAKSISQLETGDRLDRLKMSTLLKLLVTYHITAERFFSPEWEISEATKRLPNWGGLRR